MLTSEEGLLIAARRVDGDFEQHLGMIESKKNLRKGEEMSKLIC